MGRKQPSVLFLVHIEEMFRDYFPNDPKDNYTGEQWLKRLVRACKSHDRVVALTSQVQDDHCVEELYRHTDAEWIWGWGYEKGMSYDPCTCGHWPQCDPTCESDTWLISSTGHEYTWIPAEIRSMEWRNWHITVAGGCEGECLADWLAVLDHLKLRYRLPANYVY